MGNINLADLVQGAIQVRDEQTPKGNTNTRVGSLLLAIVEYIGNIEGQLRGDDIDELARQIQAEVTARQQADTNLSNQTNTSLNGINTLVINLQNALNKEVGTDRNVAINAAITTLHNELSTALGEKASKTELEAVNEALQKLDVGVTDIELQKMVVRTSAGELQFLTGITVGKGSEQKVLELPEANLSQNGLMTPTHVSKLEGAINEIQKGRANGVATLDPNGKLSEEQIPEKINAVAGIYNVTVEVPLPDRVYYSLTDLEEQYSATAVAFANGKAKKGLILSFAVSATQWKTYQYTGSAIDKNAWCNADNWTDFGSLAAGSEGYIDINHVLGNTTRYTISSALEALKAYQQGSSICYDKLGMVIAFLADDGSVDTRQFKGEAVTDFFEASLWGAFGGGSSVETSDTPEKEGKDALSTGGAYKAIPAKLGVNTETPGVVKVVMLNADGEPVGDEEQFTVGTPGGGGEQSGTLVYIFPKESPIYGKAAGEILIECSIRSVTQSGAQEVLNTIERVELIDRDTNQTLATYRVNAPSSADAESYDFSFDVSSYFAKAGSRKFRLVAYDDSDNSGSRNINVTAVDVTVTSVQTLNYTASTVLAPNGSAKTLPMYRFANNASDKGIECTAEMLVSGEWIMLGKAVISDTYSHSITIDPKNVGGHTLSHGAYPIRIHGVDIASGVQGNWLHTTVMCIDSLRPETIVAQRWYTDSERGTVKLYQSVSVDFAVYNPAATSAQVAVKEVISRNGNDGAAIVKRTSTAYRNTTYTYVQKIGNGEALDGSIAVKLVTSSGGSSSSVAEWVISGTLVDITPVTTQLMFDMDMSERSNDDTDKNITDGGYTLSLTGANYSTNGFVKDSFGTEQYGTDADTGIMALRIAENVTGTLDYQPFNVPAIEQNGLALQFRIRVKNVADDNAKLISCIANGIGFYVSGKNVVFTTDGEATVARTITAALKEDSITDVAIVIEPTSQAPYGGIGVVKMYFDGELIGTCFYNQGTFARHQTPITFDGHHGELFLYNIRAWETYFSFEQSFDNYLLKMSDTDSMLKEYEFNDVMSSQAAEGKPATNRPQAAALHSIGIPYFVVCKNADTDNVDDQYPDYLETLDGDKKTTRILDIYAYFPDRPWQDFKAIGVTVSNQGTTSSQRPIKNIKMKFKKCQGITLLRDRSEFSGEDLAKYDACAVNAAAKKVQPTETSMPTNIITVKVDYSESGGANNGGSTQLYNELQRAMGANYMTPAQNAYKGKYVLNTSIDSVPCAFFRTDKHATDPTSPSYGYFHAKGNWNYDKGDPAVFGFEGVDGYNKNCLNYGKFWELVAERGQSLEDFAAQCNHEEWNAMYMDEEETTPVTIMVLSEFCGPNHKVYRKRNRGTEEDPDYYWEETTGTMTFSEGKWTVTGDVVNPVECYEIKTYVGLSWFQGVKTMDDMLALSNGKPCWLADFESRYPDDDNLNALYESGKKLPYTLYKWLKWCEDCNQNNTAGNITINGVNAVGTKANRLRKFEQELHKEANVYSAICYHAFTDYIAAVDQRSKNMMVGFYLDTDGAVRMYLNHLYDGDTILGSDNDCGLTIPAELDPNNDTEGFYQGWDSVLFHQLAKAGNIVADNDGNTVTVQSIVSQMRLKTNSDGLVPFSPAGIEKYWINDRLSKWPKIVSSYDGIRKYIEHSTSNANYFYALHGLSIQRLQEFVKTRFLYRDGYYRCGDTFKSAAAFRCVGNNISVTIKAAKSGYFGLGVDRANEANGGSAYLQAGESKTFNTGISNTGGGVMLYLFGADKVEELYLTNATPKQSGFTIGQCTLLKKLVIGGAGYTMPTASGEELSDLALGNMPFLEEVDIRNFGGNKVGGGVCGIVSVDATYCPRLVTLLATGSSLQTLKLAETSPISTLALPGSMVRMSLVNLPNLKFPNGGLSFDGFTAMQSLELRGCNNISTLDLLKAICIDGNARLKTISVKDVDIKGSGEILEALMNARTMGIGSDADNVCDGITGRWMFNSFVNPKLLASLSEYFVALDIYNAQYTSIVMDDTVADPCNYSNEDNKTGYAYNNAFKASGHLSVIRDSLTPISGKYNPETDAFEAVAISRDDYGYLADGLTPFDNTDNSGTLNDVMMLFPHCWFKGVNDFKNQKKYTFWSSTDNEPLSSASRSNRKNLSECLFSANKAISIRDVQVGSTDINVEGTLVAAAGASTYKIDVEGMKQLRYPGMNSNDFGVMFTDAEGIAIGTFFMAVSHGYFDFVTGDYVFCDVPEGAVTAYFTSYNTVPGTEMVLATDSTEIEAIEPDWVENKQNWCVGVYQAWVDELYRLRSIAGKTPRTGTNTSTTASWNYDAEGNPTMMTLSTTVNYTVKDFMNMAQLRGKGYQMIDYEMSKFIAILFYSTVGNRDSSSVIGFGTSAALVSGYSDRIGIGNSERGQFSGNKALGLESILGVRSESMDYVGVNIASWETWKKNRCVDNISTDPINGIWHIYDPLTKTERTVQGLTSAGGQDICRVKHGRHCDVVPSKTTSDTSKYVEHYCDGTWYNASRGRVLFRSYYYAYAYGGLVYAYAYNASSYSSAYFGARLAFRGTIVLKDA